MAKRTTAKESTTKAPKTREVRMLVHRREARKALCGMPERTFATLESEGVIVAEHRGRGGRKSTYDLEVIVPAYIEYRLKKQAGATGGIQDARSRRDRSQAELNELKLQRERGELISRDQFVLEGEHYTKAWAAMLRSLPRQLVQDGVVMRDQESAVIARVRDILAEIASWRTLEDMKKVVTKEALAS